MIKSILLLVSLLFTYHVLPAQLSGIVTDENNEPLSYVNIYVKSTSSGTTTNFDGEYILKLEKGEHDIVFQYVGYKSITETIQSNSSPLELNIQLVPEKYQLETLEINANAEDPAYAIIRKAQKKRKYYRDKMNRYECDAYVKGFNKVLSAPEKIFGQEIGDMDGALDSTRQGVVYLSESVSRLYVNGNKSKEVLYSSKVSGNDQGYSFNSAQEMNINFYESNIDLDSRILISPISPRAMSYYNYSLEGTQYDNNGLLINKIKVTPKNEFSPTFYGYIYINEDLWNIHSLELGATSKAMQLSLIDSLVFKQIFAPLQDDHWMPLSNVIKFQLGAFGFKVEGNFACIYSNYVLDNIDESIFNNEVFKVEKLANKRSEEYWDSLRPIPLTVEERVDYKLKDSIRIVRTSPAYLDSIDRENNKLGAFDVLTGYRYQNSIKQTSISYSGLLSSLGINTIQGFTADLKVSYRKLYDKDYSRYLVISGNVNYGFSERVFRPELRLFYKANGYNNLHVDVNGGRKLEQYSSRRPAISSTLNSVMTYFFRRNYLKAYDKKYGTVAVGGYLSSILYGKLSLAYEDRSAVANNFDSSLFYKDSREFTSNNPQDLSSDSEAFNDHQALILSANLKINFGQKLWSYPNQTFRVKSDWPALSLFYKKAIPTLGGDADYDLLYANVSKSFSIGRVGVLRGYATAGKYLSSDNIPFIDYYHFLGNQTHVADPSDYVNHFLLLNYYTHSSTGEFAEIHAEHNFNGFILSRLPLFKRLEWKLAMGAKLLKSSERDVYTEYHVGIDNIGYKLFRLFRVDLVWANQNCDILGTCNEGESKVGVVVGLKVGL